MANQQKIKVDSIRIDGGTQPRSEIDDSVVSEYAEQMRHGVEFPPVVVFNDGVCYWLADGFHRTHAARRAESGSLLAEVHNGTKRDAVLYSVGANSAHGIRRTNTDKRKAVMTLLQDAEWGQWSNSEIGKQCAVSHTFVNRLRGSLETDSSEPAPPRTYTTKHGTTATMNTSNIGKQEKPPEGKKFTEDEPEKKDIEESSQPQIRGIGMRLAYEAIAVLKRIPFDDGLKQDAYSTVKDWIETNRGN